MLEASVEMSMFIESHNLNKVRIIDVCIDTKHLSQNPHHEILKV